MWHYFTYSNTHRYIEVLQQIVHVYNDAHHNSIIAGRRQISYVYKLQDQAGEDIL